MNRIDRLTAILIQLQSKTIVKAREIAERFDINLRTVYRDIRALEDAGVPIGAQAGEGYFIIDGYHLPPVMFTQEEAGAMLMAGKLMDQFSDESAHNRFDSAMYKIKSVLEESDKEFLSQLDQRVQVYKENSLVSNNDNSEMLSDLQLLVGQRKMAEIIYTSPYSGSTTTRLVEPLGLCFWGGNWHLIAYCTLRKDYRDFRTSRIRQLTPTGIIFNSDRHPSTRDILTSMNTPEALKPAVIRFDTALAMLIQERKYYYGFIDETDHGDSIEMTFMTPSYSNFSIWLLGFLDQIQVISPNILISHLKDHTLRLQRKYL